MSATLSANSNASNTPLSNTKPPLAIYARLFNSLPLLKTTGAPLFTRKNTTDFLNT